MSRLSATCEERKRIRDVLGRPGRLTLDAVSSIVIAAYGSRVVRLAVCGGLFPREPTCQV